MDNFLGKKCTTRENPGYAYEKRAPAFRWYGAPEWLIRPCFGGLRATYDGHLRLIGKRVVDFLLVLIELFAKALRRYLVNTVTL